MVNVTKEQTNLSVVIPTKGREESLLETVRSLVEQECLPQEIIIVDQSLQKGSDKKVNSLIPEGVNLIYVYNNNLSGLTQAKNFGIKRATGKFILFLDDDIIVLENAIKNVLDVFMNDTEKKIGGVGGVLVNEKPPCIFRFARIFFCGPFSFYNDQSIFQWRARQSDTVMQLSRLIPGGACCVRAEVFNNFSFDENLYGYSYGEDSIFGYTVSSRYKLFLYSGFKLYHKRICSKRDNLEMNIHMQIIWWFYFFDKYVEKTIYNIICFVWSLVGILCKIVSKFYSPSALKGGVHALRSMLRVVFRRSTIEAEVRDCLS